MYVCMCFTRVFFENPFVTNVMPSNVPNFILPSSPSRGDDESRNHSEGNRLEKTDLCDFYTLVTDFR